MRDAIEITPGVLVTGLGAAHLLESQTAIIADVHLGYARAARRRGGYLPTSEPVDEVIERALCVINTLHVTQLIIAGDIRHSTRDADEAELREVARFIEHVSRVVRLTLVAGNHDRGSTAPRELAIGEVVIQHEPPRDIPDQWTICGHLHPSTMVRDETGAGARYPCFLIGPKICVLPAFTTWAGGTRVSRLLPQLPVGVWRRIVVWEGVVYAV
jgi:uncharacterized protein